MKKRFIILILPFIIITGISAQSIFFLQEGFENAYTFPPAGWLSLDVDGDGYSWQRSPVGAWNTHSGSGCASSASYNSNNNTVLTPNNYLITPVISVQSMGYELKYYVAGQDNLYSAEHYKVAISTTGVYPSDFVHVLHEETLPWASYKQYYERVLSLDDYINQDIYIAFIHYNCTNQFFLNLDDVSVSITFDVNAKLVDITAPEGSCDLPNEIFPAIKIENNGANSFSDFIVSYVFNGTTINETISDTVLPGHIFNYVFNQSVLVPANGIYSLKATVSVLGDLFPDDNEFEKQISLGPAETAYHINFEPGEDASFWRIIDINGDGRSWSWASTGGNQNPGCLRYNYSNVNAANDAFFSKCLFLESGKNYKLSFYYKGGSTYFQERLKVFLNYSQTFADTVFMMTAIDSIKNVTYRKHETVFSVDVDSVYYLNFLACSDVNNLFLYIDDVSVEEIFDFDAYVEVIKPEYYSIPLKQTRPLLFEGLAKNLGETELSNVEVVTEINNSILLSNYSIGDLAPNQTYNILLNDNFTPYSIGLYTVKMTIESLEEDQNLLNNTDSVFFTISDTIMARENGIVVGGLGIGSRGVLGHKFELTSPDTLTSVSFYLKSPTVGDTVSVSIYSFSNVPEQLLRTSDKMVITTSSSAWYTLPIQGGYLPLEEGGFFVGINEYRENITLGTNPHFHKDSSSFINYMTYGWQTNEALGFPITYLLRANFGQFTKRLDYNAGVINIFSPVNDCNVNPNATINLKIQNFGHKEINGLKIICNCNGQVLTDSLEMLINPWQEVSHTMQGSLDLSIPNTYTISCYTDLFNDEDNSDDVFVKIIQSGPQNVPYFCGFEANEDLSWWKVEDANNDYFTWKLDYESPLIANTGTNAAIYQYNLMGTVAANDWLYSKCLQLDSGATYKVEFSYKTGIYNGINYYEKLKLHLLTQPFSIYADNENLIHDFGTLGNNQYNHFEKLINIDSTGTYYIAFHVYSDANQFYLAIDDFNIHLSDETNISQNIDDNIIVFPNPATNTININSLTNINSIVLYDIKGLMHYSSINCNLNYSIDVSSFSKGMYFIKIKTDNGIFVKKIALM